MFQNTDHTTSNNHCKTRLLRPAAAANGNGDIDEEQPPSNGGDNVSNHMASSSVGSPGGGARNRFPNNSTSRTAAAFDGGVRFRPKSAPVSMGVRIDEACRVLFPLNFLCFNIFYWWYYLYY